MLSILKNYPRWDLLLWMAWCLMFFVLEGIGLARTDKAVPLTWVIRAAAPRWILAGILGWLCYHFLIQTGTGPVVN